MSEPITYAKAGETPGAPDLHVYNLDTGLEVLHVNEVNTLEGWVIHYVRTADGGLLVEGDEFVQRRVTGRFEIRRQSIP